MYHCNDCHAERSGVNAMEHLLTGWSREMVATSVRHPEKLKYFMPPWSGTDAEAEILTDYLMDMRPEMPEGMFFGGRHDSLSDVQAMIGNTVEEAR